MTPVDPSEPATETPTTPESEDGGETGERIRRAGQVAWALAGLTVILLIMGYVAWYLRVIWPPLVLAGVIVFLLNPIVTWLQERRIPRALGTGLAYLGVLGALVLAGVLIAPQVRNQWDQLADEWPDLRDDIEVWVDDRAAQSRDEDWPVEIPTFAELEDSVTGGVVSGDQDDDGEVSSEERTEQLLATIDSARDIGLRVFNIGLIVLMAPIIAFYLLVDLPNIRRSVVNLLPGGRREEVLAVGRRLNRTIGGYFRGQLMVATVVGIMAAAGMAAIDLPFWLVVGLIVGVTNMIPMIGPWIGAVPAVIIALTTRDITTAGWAVAVLVGVQQVDNNWISPVVMKRAIKLHPAVVMLALLAGGSLFGFVGLLLVVPVVAMLKVLVGHLWRTYVLGQSLEVTEQAFQDMLDEGGGLVTDVERRQARSRRSWRRRSGGAPAGAGGAGGEVGGAPDEAGPGGAGEQELTDAAREAGDVPEVPRG